MLQAFREILIALFVLAGLGLAHAQGVSSCAPEGAVPLVLARIELDGTLRDPAGNGFLLAGLVWPDSLEPLRQNALKTLLEQALAGETLFYKPAAPPDRWGLRPVHLFVQENAATQAPFWLQAGLAARGAMPGWPEIEPACWQLLLAHEAEARRARRGYWAPRAQAARHLAIARAPARHAGRRMVARWPVHSVRATGGNTYVNIVPFFRVGPSLALNARQSRQLMGPAPPRPGQRIIARFLSGPEGLKRARLGPGESLAPEQE